MFPCRTCSAEVDHVLNNYSTSGSESIKEKKEQHFFRKCVAQERFFDDVIISRPGRNVITGYVSLRLEKKIKKIPICEWCDEMSCRFRIHAS